MRLREDIASNFVISFFCVLGGVLLYTILRYVGTVSMASYVLPLSVAGLGVFGVCRTFYQAYRQIENLESDIELAGQSYFQLGREAEILEGENRFLKARMGSFEMQLEQYEENLNCDPMDFQPEPLAEDGIPTT